MRRFIWIWITPLVGSLFAWGQIGSQRDWVWGGSLGYHGSTGDLSDFKPGFDAALVLMRFRQERQVWFFDVGTAVARFDRPVVLSGDNSRQSESLVGDVRLLYMNFMKTVVRWAPRMRVSVGGGPGRFDLGSRDEDASGVSLVLEGAYNLNRTTSLIARYGQFWEWDAPDTRSSLNPGRWTIGLRWVPRAVKIF